MLVLQVHEPIIGLDHLGHNMLTQKNSLAMEVITTKYINPPNTLFNNDHQLKKI